jgi:succinyl-CoA synthetase beta subunit
LVAEGVVGALADMNLNAHTFPVVAREVGTYDREGRAIFERAGIEYLDEEVTLEIAAKRIVDRVSAVRAVS